MRLDVDIGKCNASKLGAMLRALTAVNVDNLSHDPSLPRLYSSGTRYERERRIRGKRLEVWKNNRRTYRDKKGDCEELAAARAAELQYYDHIDAEAIAYPTRTGYHCVVLHPDGSIEDPSKKLGMGAEKQTRPHLSRRNAPGLEVGSEGAMRIKVRFWKNKKSKEWHGEIIVPLEGGIPQKLALQGTGTSGPAALAQSADALSTIMAMPGVSSLLPPGTAQAVSTIRGLADSQAGKAVLRAGGDIAKGASKVLGKLNPFSW